jgi:alpha-ketoglutarate-dependent taurine dioxygenase/4-hydroxybenzoate polyprenyltransferase
MSTRLLEPFGIEVSVPAGSEWGAIDAEQVRAWVAAHRVVVIRGVRDMKKGELPLAARRLGPLQVWPFGSVNELIPDPQARNYLYTTREVPLHWDGAFAGRVPRYLFFHCVAADVWDGGGGGETLFVDTTRVLARADDATKDRWRALSFAYETETIAHYGGRFRASVVASHPDSGEAVIRFAEPVADLNPVTVRAEGLSPLASAARVTELRLALRDPSAVLAHAWRAGDLVIADNHALLHGRRAFPGGERRHIRRVNVHGPERGRWDSLRDALRIRRPEFLAAEIPILLIPVLLVSGRLASARFAETALLFFLLFHFGDMMNCLADRALDAVYKTRLSEAVLGLGVRSVAGQIAITALLALAVGTHLAVLTSRPELSALVLVGLILGAQYSVGPLRLKGRGVFQVATLWAVIFVGPMLLVARAMGGALAWPLALLIASYGAMQEGIVLVNTAEDLPEDEEAGVTTTAVALGLSRCLALAMALVCVGGLGVAGALAAMATDRGASVPVALGPLAAAWVWVTWEVTSAWRAVRGPSADGAIRALRPRARRMPLWIAATAWGTLAGAVIVGLS